MLLRSLIDAATAVLTRVFCAPASIDDGNNEPAAETLLSAAEIDRLADASLEAHRKEEAWLKEEARHEDEIARMVRSEEAAREELEYAEEQARYEAQLAAEEEAWLLAAWRKEAAEDAEFELTAAEEDELELTAADEAELEEERWGQFNRAMIRFTAQLAAEGREREAREQQDREYIEEERRYQAHLAEVEDRERAFLDGLVA